MAEKTNVPEIRFAGFTDPWEQRKLGELMDVASVRRVHQEDWTDEGVRFLRARDLVSFAKNESIEDPLFISSEMYKEYSAQSGKVSVGDLLVTGVGTIGVPWLVTSDNPVYFKDGNIIWFKNRYSIDGGFFYHSFTASAIQNYINEAAGIGTVGTYTIETGKKTPIWLPSRQEQREIAAMMTHLDTLITLHQRKYDKLAQLKKSMLDKMFPKPGERFPEIRFAGFTDPWEQRKLGDCVGSTYGGGTPSTSHDEYWGGNIPWIQSSNVLENELFRIDIPKAITQDGLSKSAALQVPGNSIAVVTHVGVGKLVYLPFPYATSQDFVSLSELKGDANFLCYAIHRKLQSELHMVQGSAIKGITKEELLGKAIFLPAAEEQKLVGNQMRAIDNLITLHQRKLELLRNTKKSLLDRMFV